MSMFTLGHFGHGFFSSTTEAREDDVFMQIEGWGSDPATVSYKALVAGESELVAFADVDIPAGSKIVGHITELEVTAGEVLGYYKTRGAVPETPDPEE
jgi:hypothetical protein